MQADILCVCVCVSVLGYRDVCSEVVQGRLGLLGHRRKLSDLQQICERCILLCNVKLYQCTGID
jgi:hypothetical protein